LEGDGVAEGFQRANVVAFTAFRADAVVVEVGSQIVEAGVGVGQQVPDGDQDGPANRDDRFEFAAAFGDASVAFTQEGVGLAGGGGRLAEDAGQVGVAVAGGVAAFLLTGRLFDPDSSGG
jgi:hypothetical protein